MSVFWIVAAVWLIGSMLMSRNNKAQEENYANYVNKKRADEEKKKRDELFKGLQ